MNGTYPREWSVTVRRPDCDFEDVDSDFNFENMEKGIEQ